MQNAENGYFLFPKKELTEINKKLEQVLEYVKTGRIKDEIIGQWASEDEVAELLGLSRTSLWSLRCRGILSSTKIGGRVYYHLPTIKQYLDDNKQ